MSEIFNIEEYFRKGVPLEQPSVLLEWHAPLSLVARESDGKWNGQCYLWPKSSFLSGLDFPLMSKVGISEEEPFEQITALIGVDPNTSLWSDELSLIGFERVGAHLQGLIDKPSSESLSEETDARFLSWRKGPIQLHLSIVEVHCFRCTLDVSVIE